ncbi:serine/threonine-protein kinase 17B [Aplysia californica]|uniref:Serine/threonine-protein kinase 17B n=1 Tax=Aplysia californica TaxID=6500 RepID=A0ABM0K6K3_APLCA|nr:serine/threonine-protein kinase 17B [Aplysia californica]
MNGLSPGKYVPSSPICTDPFNTKYTVQEDIGRGKFAVVRKCVNKESGEVVAAKVIRKRRKGKSCREEILREVVMLELAMAHPRLVSLREVFETQSELILVTEYCSGGELFHECVIKESFKEDDVRKLLVQILEGLAYLHDNNIVHLDLKPQNILLTKPFPDGDVKICDLGFACLTNTGEDIRDIIGTPDYVAPEVLDYEPLNIQTDMWSLGVLTYVMLTTYSPFAGDTQQETFCNITQAKLDFPDSLFGHINSLAQDFIAKLLVKKPRDRMTARQCLDHPWLKDLKQSMSIHVPTPDHSEGLAQDMVVPSNWHMSPDRRSNLPSAEASVSNHRDMPVITEASSPPKPVQNSGLEVSAVIDTPVVPSGRTSISEEKDSISNTLSNIGIDNHSIDRSSTASFETCAESLEGGSSSDVSPFMPCVDKSSTVFSSADTATSTTLTTTSQPSVSSSHHSDTISAFASDVVAGVTGLTPAARDRVVEPSGGQNIQEASVCVQDQSAGDNDVASPVSEITGSHPLPCATSPRDSNKLDYSKKRMSMEIPPKKAKCIQDEAETPAVQGANGSSASANPIPREHVVVSNSDVSIHSCNGIEDCRNAV